MITNRCFHKPTRALPQLALLLLLAINLPAQWSEQRLLSFGSPGQPLSSPNWLIIGTDGFVYTSVFDDSSTGWNCGCGMLIKASRTGQSFTILTPLNGMYGSGYFPAD